MKSKLFFVLATLLAASSSAFAWNPITDFKDNLVWTVGKQAEAGTAVKLWGAGDLKKGETTTSMLAGIADYRCLTFSYGGTFVNKTDAKMSDTFKVGFKLNRFFSWFAHSPTPEMAFLSNVNVGPSYSVPVFSRPKVGAVFLDVNYTFGGSSTQN